MFLKIFMSALIAIVLSCSKTDSKLKQTTTSQVDSSVAAITDTHISFGTELIEQKKACDSAFKSIKTSNDFLTAYHLLDQLEIDMNKKFDQITDVLDYNDFLEKITKMMGNALPWISADLIAEGTVPVSVINNKELKKSALLSPEKDDDAFVDLLLAIYEESGSLHTGVPAWTVMNCDVCYSSILGSGTTLRILQIVDSIKAASSQFATDAQRNVEPFFTGKSEIFELSRDEITAEIDQILETIVLTDTQKSFLIAYREAVSDTSKSHVQINCGDGHCRYY